MTGLLTVASLASARVAARRGHHLPLRLRLSTSTLGTVLLVFQRGSSAHSSRSPAANRAWDNDMSLAGSPDAVVSRGRRRGRRPIRPVFDAIGRKTVWQDEVGAATLLKLVTNSWIAALNVAAGESVALARALGIDPEAFLEAVAVGLSDSPYLHMKARARGSPGLRCCRRGLCGRAPGLGCAGAVR